MELKILEDFWKKVLYLSELKWIYYDFPNKK
jgi:hypothetical protein